MGPELFEFDLAFHPRASIKAQVVVEFVTEYTILEGESEEGNSTLKDPKSQWAIYMDGALDANGSRVGLILTNPEGEDIQYALSFGFSSINNEAEYEALIIRLTINKELGVQHLNAYSDLQLVIGHVLNEYEAREESMKKYLQKVKNLIPAFCSFGIL